MGKIKKGKLVGPATLTGAGGPLSGTSLTGTANPFHRSHFKFSDQKVRAARLEASLATGSLSLLTDSLTASNLAAPHRAPFAGLKSVIREGNAPQVRERIVKLLDASKKFENALKKVSLDPRKAEFHELREIYQNTRTDTILALNEYLLAPKDVEKQKDLLKAVNNLASNAPGLGPHFGINHRVQNNLHFHPKSDGSLTPRSQAAGEAFPEIEVAVTQDEKNFVSVTGNLDFKVSAKYTLLKAINTLKKPITRGALILGDDDKLYRPKGELDFEEIE